MTSDQFTKAGVVLARCLNRKVGPDGLPTSAGGQRNRLRYDLIELLKAGGVSVPSDIRFSGD